MLIAFMNRLFILAVIAALSLALSCPASRAMSKRAWPFDARGRLIEEAAPSVVKDASCLNSLGSTILNLPDDELLRQFENASFDFQVDTMLCAEKAGLADVAVKLFEFMVNGGEAIVEPLKRRLKVAEDDHAISRLLIIFVALEWQYYDQAERLLLDKQTVLFLLANAQRITEKPLRDICLDWLEPMLEAMDQQRKRQ